MTDQGIGKQDGVGEVHSVLPTRLAQADRSGRATGRNCGLTPPEARRTPGAQAPMRTAGYFCQSFRQVTAMPIRSSERAPSSHALAGSTRCSARQSSSHWAAKGCAAAPVPAAAALAALPQADKLLITSSRAKKPAAATRFSFSTVVFIAFACLPFVHSFRPDPPAAHALQSGALAPLRAPSRPRWLLYTRTTGRERRKMREAMDTVTICG